MKSAIQTQISKCVMNFPHLFRVDSLSVIEEYLRCRPSLVKCVVGSSRTPFVDQYLRENPSVLVCSKDEWNSAVDLGLQVKSSLSCFISISPLDEKSFFLKLAKESPSLIMAVDHINDPHNLGAIARSSAFFGVKYIIVPKNRQVGVTQGGVQSAQGAFAFLDIVQVTNLARTLKEIKNHRYWVFGASMEGVDVRRSKGLSWEHSVVVLGAEHKGLSPLVKKTCDQLISIQGVDHTVGSLNVSVAAGLILDKFFATRAEP